MYCYEHRTRWTALREDLYLTSSKSLKEYGKYG